MSGRTRAFLAGEGRNELGTAAQTVQPNVPVPGVLHALLHHVTQDPWELASAVQWKNIRKFQAGNHRSAEERNVRGAALMATESGADLLAFVRDRDKDKQRQKDIELGISKVTSVAVAGGVAIERLEDWIDAARRGADPNAPARELSTAQMVAIIDGLDEARLGRDRRGRKIWLANARRVFADIEEPG